MGLFNDGIDYSTYRDSTIDAEDNQIDNDIVIADQTNYNYVFESSTPLETILNQLPGYIMKVIYYNKSPGNQEVYEMPDFTLDDTIVEYAKIQNMTIYAESPIDVTELRDYEGSGYITSKIEPQPGDFFLAKLYDGRLGLFVITITDNITYNLNRIFKITFKFNMFVDDNLLEQIEKNVDKTLIADNKLNNNNDEILYDEDRYITIRRLLNLEDKYFNIWKRLFITPDTNYTLSFVDELWGVVNDPYLENFITSIKNISDMENIVLSNIDDNKLTILNYLLDKDLIGMSIYKNYRFLGADDMLQQPFLKTYSYNQMNAIVDLTEESTDDFYIFTEKFYTLLESTSEDEIIFDTAFEACIFNILNDLDITVDMLETAIDEVDDLIKNKDRKIFYYIPLLILIFRYYKFKHNYPDKFLY